MPCGERRFKACWPVSLGPELGRETIYKSSGELFVSAVDPCDPCSLALASEMQFCKEDIGLGNPELTFYILH